MNQEKISSLLEKLRKLDNANKWHQEYFRHTMNEVRKELSEVEGTLEPKAESKEADSSPIGKRRKVNSSSKGSKSGTSTSSGSKTGTFGNKLSAIGNGSAVSNTVSGGTFIAAENVVVDPPSPNQGEANENADTVANIHQPWL